MKPPPFEYHAPTSVQDVLDALATLEDAKVIAGGQSLIPLLSLRLARPAHLIDVGRVAELSGIAANGDLTIAAATRQRTVERDTTVAERWPLITEALGLVGHPPIRNRGTFGGSLAHADPAAELPTVATVLDAQFVARSKKDGERVIGAQDFFVSIFETALREDELLTHVRVPALPARTGSSFHEVARRHGDFAIVGAAAVVTRGDGDTIADARIAFSGVALTPVRAPVAEERLRGAGPDAIADAAAAAAAGLEPSSDLHGSAAYRKHIAAVVARRALEDAWRRSG